MNFQKVATLFQNLETIQSRLEMTQQLAMLLKEATPQEAKQLCYLSLGALNPPYIATQFNVAQKNMSKIVAHILVKTVNDVEEEKRKLGDLGTVIAQGNWHAQKDLSVDDVYQKLVTIEKVSGTGSQDLKADHIKELLEWVSPIAAKYIVRIILGTLRLGFSDMTLVDALSWMHMGDKSERTVIEHAYNICADIGLIAFVAKTEGMQGIRAMQIHVGIPIRPAAAERLPDVQSIIDKLGKCVAQPKLDGFRLQVHVDNSQAEPVIRFFSRNLSDMSAMFPEFVKACKELTVQNFIAEGEAMVFDPNTKQFASFQETVKRRRKHGIEHIQSELPLQLYLFDLLYLDGKSLLDATHIERRECLSHLLQNNKNETLQLIEQKTIHTPKELEHYFISEIAAGLEGLVIKKPEAVYQPGKRNSNWIKLKYQATDKLSDTLDVVVLGYYYGQGKRSQFGIGAFLVGIYNPRDEKFETVAKVGTGLTDLEWIELKARCDELKVITMPKNIFCSKQLEPDVWVEPKIVCEVLADEITLSPLHTAGKTEAHLGYALRFPRFVKYRDDKDVFQATTVTELRTLHQRTG